MGVDRPSSTIPGVSWEPRSSLGGGRRETEEPRKDSSAGDAWSPADLGGGLGVKGHEGETKATSAGGKRKAAWDIFRLGSRCLQGERSVKRMPVSPPPSEKNNS